MSTRDRSGVGARTRSDRSMRGVFLVAHRYVGLAISVFLILLGVTGSVIAFMEELDGLVNPELVLNRPGAEGRQLLDPFVLQERVRAQLPEKSVESVALRLSPDRAASFWIDGRDYFVDAYSGDILGSRAFGELHEGKKNILTFIYELHASLALGEIGMWILGGVALLWTMDCFVGAYLTFPLPARSKEKQTGRVWFVRWLPSWLLKTSQLFSLVFTWHRASGLWFWCMFFVFAWSGVALNLYDSVYRPVMNLAFDHSADIWEQIPESSSPRMSPGLKGRSALEVGQRLMEQEAVKRDFQVLSERWLSYDEEHGVYSYWVESTLDISDRLAETYVVFDGDTGELRGFSARAGLQTGDTIHTWLIALHFGTLRVGGLAYRIFVSLMGLVVVTLSVTGVWIWWRKFSRKRRASSRVGSHV